MKARHETLARLHAALLGAAGFSALTIGTAAADSSYPLCTIDGTNTIVTCIGDQAAAGVKIDDMGVTELDVNGLTSDIVPAIGTPGVVLDTSSAATVAIDTAGYKISTSGAGDGDEGAAGVYVASWGAGTDAHLTLTGDVQSDGARGVVVNATGAATSNTTGDIASLYQALGIDAEGGPVEVDHTGNLTSDEGGGLSVLAKGGSDITVTGDIDSLGTGIYSHNYDAGLTTVIQNGNITARQGSGIVAEEATGTATVTATGEIAANVDGISVTANGDVSIAQTGGPLTADNGTGIYGFSGAGSVAITRDSSALSAGGNGIYAEAHGNFGDGDVTINSPGTITAGANGIVASTADDMIGITLGGTTTATGDAIWAQAMGDHDFGIDITSGGNIVSWNGKGIYAYTTGRGFTDAGVTYGVRVQQTGNVTSKLDALTAIATQSGVSVNANGAVTSYDGNGVHAESANGDVDIDTGAVTSGLESIYGLTNNGDLTINTGAITSNHADGIHAHADEGDVTVTVSGATTTELDAIYAQSNDGQVKVQAGTVLSNKGKGVSAQSDNGTVVVSTGGVTTELDAIQAQAQNGTVTVTTTGGGVTSNQGQAVLATADAGAVNVDIGGAVEAGGKGIEAQTDTGNVDVKVAGDVGSKGDAISAVTLNGTVNVDVDGNVASYDGRAIHATTPDGSVTVNVGDGSGTVTSQLDAIYTQSNAGAIDIKTGEVNSYSGKGVYAQSGGGTVGVAIDGDVTAELDAIYAQSDTSTVTINAGDVVSNKGNGVYAQSDSGAVGVTIGSLTSELAGIYVQSDAGNVTVDASGGITAYKGRGIEALSNSGTVDIEVGGDLWAGDKGILAQTKSGRIDVTVDGDVTGTSDAITANADSGAIDIQAGDIVSFNGRGIYALTDSGTVTIGAGGLTSQLIGIYARSKDSDVAIDLSGGLTSYSGSGIHAFTPNGNVTIGVDGPITSQGTAIFAGTKGGSSSTIGITTGGDITSYGGRGIVAKSATGTITIHNSGALTSELDGIVARTTGAGTSGAVSVTQDGALQSWKGKGIDASSAQGPVTIVTNAGVEADLDGIVAQSTGGDAGVVSVTSSGGSIISYKGAGIVASSAGGEVTVTNTGAIIADQGGIRAAGTGGAPTATVKVEQTGDITIANGIGIETQAVEDTEVSLDGDITGGNRGISATSLRGAATVTVDAGSAISGASERGVYISSATTGTLTNHGAISSAYGLALEFDGPGAGTVDNYGTVSGDFAFNVGEGTFNNHAGATYTASTEMEFSGGGVFNNDGTLALSDGMTGSIRRTTTLNGNFAQSSTGTLYADVDLAAGSADLLAVSGTADLAGQLTLNVVGGDVTDGILGAYDFLTAADGVTLNGMTVSNPTLNGVVASDTGKDALVRVAGIDFNPAGVSTAAAPTSTYIQNVFASGAPKQLEPLLRALVNTPDMPAYEAALAQLTPESYSDELQNSYGYNLGFSNRLLSCRVPDGPNRFKAEGDCDWFDMRGTVFQQGQDRTQDFLSQTFATLEAGAQRRITDTLRLGAGLGITQATTMSGGGSVTRATEAQAGMIVKYDAGPLILASALSTGYGVHHDERHVVIGAFDDVLTGDAPIAYLSARINVAYTFDMGVAYIRPLFNLDLTATHFGGVTETGGGAALTVEASTQFAAMFNPAIEFGGEIKGPNGSLIRPYLQVGTESAITSDLALAARFAGVGPGVGSFTINQPASEPMLKLSLGADVLTEDHATVRVYYDAGIGATSRSNSIGMKVSNRIE